MLLFQVKFHKSLISIAYVPLSSARFPGSWSQALPAGAFSSNWGSGLIRGQSKRDRIDLWSLTPRGSTQEHAEAGPGRTGVWKSIQTE